VAAVFKGNAIAEGGPPTTMAKKTSLKDIAQYVGVSTALVSYVLNGKEKQGRVGHQKVLEIRQAAKLLNYQPNLIARGLRKGQTKTIGLIVADISNPFFASLAKIVEELARDLGYIVLFGSSDEQEYKSGYLIDVFLNRQVDAFIICPVSGSEKQIKDLQQMGKPVVLIDRYFPGLPADSVRINNKESALRAVEHQILGGRRNIALLSYQTDLAHITQRKAGYIKAIEKYGLPLNPGLIMEANYSDLEADVAQKMRELFRREKKVDGLLFATNSLAIAGLRVIEQMGIKIPKDLSVVSFDQSEVFDFYYAPLTYIAQGIRDLAEAAVSLVGKRLKEPLQTRQYITTVLEAKLIIRESSREEVPVHLPGVIPGGARQVMAPEKIECGGRHIV
jgi:LacI family transcriptional regulator